MRVEDARRADVPPNGTGAAGRVSNHSNNGRSSLSSAGNGSEGNFFSKCLHSLIETLSAIFRKIFFCFRSERVPPTPEPTIPPISQPL
jgi:hypothetical protein